MSSTKILVPRLCLGTHTQRLCLVCQRTADNSRDCHKGSASCVSVQPITHLREMPRKAEPWGMRSQAEPGNE
ncbi:hypothetical protein [Desulfonema magnum]|uniref:hypothetical protein n=1 Tax=Desulfonema magnum TaxID=45655 RepID=UPI001A9AA152|nr:hypothetical protein [Desulfonema magnum]